VQDINSGYHKVIN